MNFFDQKRPLLLFTVLFLFLLVGTTSVQAWEGNTAEAPLNNALPPINVGAITQSKEGLLKVLGLFSFGDIVVKQFSDLSDNLRMVDNNTAAYWGQSFNNTVLTWRYSDPNGVVNDRMKLSANGVLTLPNLTQQSTYPNVLVSNTAGSIGFKPITEISGGGGFWAANGTNISNTNTGNVGIGTTNPTAKLDVRGSVNLNGGDVRLSSGDFYWNAFGDYDHRAVFRDYNGNSLLVVNSNDFNGVAIGLDYPTAKLHVNGTVRLQNLPANIVNDRVITSDSNGNLGYKTISEIAGGDGKWLDTTSPQVGIYYGGNVGVNTNSIVRPLTVKGQIASVGNGNTTLNAGGLLLHDLDNARGWFVGNRGRTTSSVSANNSDNSNNFKISRCTTLNCDELVLGTNVIMPNNTFLEIDYDSGDVEVGVGNLTVDGITFTSGFYVDNMIVGDVSRPTIGVRLAGGSPKKDKILAAGDDLGQLTWKTLTELGGSSQWTTSGTNIYNNNTGNVGIGVTAPTQKLQVAGPIATQGSNGGLVLYERGGTGSFQWYATPGLVRLYSGAITGDVLQINSAGRLTLPRLAPQSAYPNVLVSDSSGNVGYKPISEISGSPVSGLPTGTAGQTLRHDGVNWVGASNLQNSGSKVTITNSPDVNENELVVNGITQTTGLLAGAISTQAFILSGNNAGAGKVLTANGTTGGASWQNITSLPAVASQPSNTGYGRVVTMNTAGDLSWRNRVNIYALYEKVTGVNSDFSFVGGTDLRSMTGGGIYTDETSGRDYFSMTCPSGYTVVSGGAECKYNSLLDKKQLETSYAPTPNQWKISCGDELRDIYRASIVCTPI